MNDSSRNKKEREDKVQGRSSSDIRDETNETRDELKDQEQNTDNA